MDPDENLREQLELATWLHDTPPEEAAYDEVLAKADRLAELVLALDDWSKNGGFPPKRWEGGFGGSL